MIGHLSIQRRMMAGSSRWDCHTAPRLTSFSSLFSGLIVISLPLWVCLGSLFIRYLSFFNTSRTLILCYLPRLDMWYSLFYFIYRHMLMGRPQCRFMNGKLVSKSSTVKYVTLRWCIWLGSWSNNNNVSIGYVVDVLFPSLLQLHGGINDVEERKQKEICDKRYRRTEKGKMSEVALEREEECGICLEIRNKVVLPTCNHSMCINCYRDWCELLPPLYSLTTQ